MLPARSAKETTNPFAAAVRLDLGLVRCAADGPLAELPRPPRLPRSATGQSNSCPSEMTPANSTVSEPPEPPQHCDGDSGDSRAVPHGHLRSASLARFWGPALFDAHEYPFAGAAAEEEGKPVPQLVGDPSCSNALRASAYEYCPQVGERLNVLTLDDLGELIANDEPRIRCDGLQRIVSTSFAHTSSMPRGVGLDSSGTRVAVHTTYSELEAVEMDDPRAFLNQRITARIALPVAPCPGAPP